MAAQVDTTLVGLLPHPVESCLDVVEAAFDEMGGAPLAGLDTARLLDLVGRTARVVARA